MRTMDLNAQEFTVPQAALGIAPKVISYMVWPDNEHKRFSFVVNHIREAGTMMAQHYKGGLNISSEFIILQSDLDVNDVSTRSMLKDALPVVVSGSSQAPQAPRIIGGQIAGQILINAMRLKYEGQSEISLKKCIDLLSDSLMHKAPKSERAKCARPKDLQIHWKKYRSVAHLWASMMILKKMIGDVDISIMLSQSEIICNDAACIKHPNAKRPLIDTEKSWRVPKDVIDVIDGT